MRFTSILTALALLGTAAALPASPLAAERIAEIERFINDHSNGTPEIRAYQGCAARYLATRKLCGIADEACGNAAERAALECAVGVRRIVEEQKARFGYRAGEPGGPAPDGPEGPDVDGPAPSGFPTAKAVDPTGLPSPSPTAKAVDPTGLPSPSPTAKAVDPTGIAYSKSSPTAKGYDPTGTGSAIPSSTEKEVDITGPPPTPRGPAPTDPAENKPRPPPGNYPMSSRLPGGGYPPAPGGYPAPKDPGAPAGPAMPNTPSGASTIPECDAEFLAAQARCPYADIACYNRAQYAVTACYARVNSQTYRYRNPSYRAAPVPLPRTATCDAEFIAAQSRCRSTDIACFVAAQDAVTKCYAKANGSPSPTASGYPPAASSSAGWPAFPATAAACQETYKRLSAGCVPGYMTCQMGAADWRNACLAKAGGSPSSSSPVPAASPSPSSSKSGWPAYPTTAAACDEMYKQLSAGCVPGYMTCQMGAQDWRTGCLAKVGGSPPSSSPAPVASPSPSPSSSKSGWPAYPTTAAACDEMYKRLSAGCVPGYMTCQMGAQDWRTGCLESVGGAQQRVAREGVEGGYWGAQNRGMWGYYPAREAEVGWPAF
ncbi:hypothetical protein HDU96_011137 [Phlyctochytrium bullatum]|nr:hypothetical protein HDU96_011137 [Phlyctochytrium bullatum]